MFSDSPQSCILISKMATLEGWGEGATKTSSWRRNIFRWITSCVCQALRSNGMRISDTLTLTRGTGKVIPAIPSLTSTSKKIQHSNFWHHKLMAVQCCSFPCICPGGQICCLGLPGTLQPTSWDPPGMFLHAETLGSYTKVFSDKTIQDIIE